MSNLKELTKSEHTNAERQAFVKVLMSGKINPKFYATYLWNQHKKYDILEAMATAQGCLDGMPEIKRKLKIEQDFLELWSDDEMPVVLDSTRAYIDHMRDIMHDSNSLMAHIYTLHMGDLSGGQMIARKVPGEGRMYHFDGDHDKLKNKIRERTSDDMADEAKWVFESATALFKELMELDIEHYLEQTD
jgi:heme oxygenase